MPAWPPPPTPYPVRPSSVSTRTRICPNQVRQSCGAPGVSGCTAHMSVIFMVFLCLQETDVPHPSLKPLSEGEYATSPYATREVSDWSLALAPGGPYNAA